MTFEQWLAANQYDAEKLSAGQRKHLEAAWKAETAPALAPPPAPAEASFDAKMAAIDAENHRIATIQQMTVSACERNRGDVEKCKQLREMCAAAVGDQKTDVRSYELALLRQERTLGPMNFVPASREQMDNTVLEAAVAQAVSLPGREKLYSEQALSAAHKQFRRGIGLKELLMVAARRNNGYSGSMNDEVALCRAAFGQTEMMADVGPTAITVPGILSNVANKFLEASFNYSEQSWRSIAKVQSLRDFKAATMYRLDGAMKFVKVAPGGEIKAGKLSELTYSLQADTYGTLIGLDRRDIINDDLGAFANVSQILGRGASDQLNELFWTTWLDDSTFFPTDKSLANYDDGATDSVLTLAGLENAYTIFNQQTKADGTPMGTMARILLVPINLEITARNLMNGQYTAGAQSTATLTTANVFQNMFTIVSSRYLSNSAITGYSATAWYLLADPNDVPCIQVGFLNGMDRPTVESSQFDFDRLGLAMRAYMDWGCAKAEYRGGIKLKGAA